MSVQLQYAAKCDECGKPMRPGTTVDFFKLDNGKYRYIHAGTCEEAPGTPAPPAQAVEDLYDFRECSHACSTRWAFDRGYSPESCHLCGAAWLSEAA